jgi:radical SAM superfamily enzyme YgiQ (UPF0313 family)
MRIFMAYVRDENFSSVLPETSSPNGTTDDGRIKVVAFPPLGIQTLAPAIREHGHEVRLFDTCHPQMKARHIAQAMQQEPPDIVALSFLSTTTYPATKAMAKHLKSVAPHTPIIVGGALDPTGG